MNYRIQIIPSALKELIRLPKRNQKRVDFQILSLATQPRPNGAKALIGLEQFYRLRVGDYRIIYKVQDQDLLILVTKIGHRKDVYRGLNKT
ncbi:MAG: type II toxin-antitoxin system RelE/ParE family toxin [Desulfomonilaceae bacterium]